MNIMERNEDKYQKALIYIREHDIYSGLSNPVYNIKQLFEYAQSKGVKVENLTEAERDMFRVRVTK